MNTTTAMSNNDAPADVAERIPEQHQVHFAGAGLQAIVVQALAHDLLQGLHVAHGLVGGHIHVLHGAHVRMQVCLCVCV